eukprot:2155954-Pyramimonas_sp.AAC.1
MLWPKLGWWMNPRRETGTTSAATVAIAAVNALLLILREVFRSPRTRTLHGSRWQPTCSVASGSSPSGGGNLDRRDGF